MRELVPRDPSPRSKKSAAEWAKEKLQSTDVVALGVNVVVGALLIGGLVGALLAHDGPVETSGPGLNAALAAHDQSNATAPSPEADNVEDVTTEGKDDREKRRKDK